MGRGPGLAAFGRGAGVHALRGPAITALAVTALAGLAVGLAGLIGLTFAHVAVWPVGSGVLGRRGGPAAAVPAVARPAAAAGE